MTEPERHYEPLTPVQAEGRLFRMTIAREEAQKALAKTRDELVDAQEALTMAKATLEFAVADVIDSGECPVVGRAPGEVTVADRDAFVVRNTRAERMAVVKATGEVRRRRAAVDAARGYVAEVSEQMMAAQSLLKSANEAFRGAGAR